MGNDKADELARKGSEDGCIGPEPTIGLAANVIASLLKGKAEVEHQKVWEQLQSCRQAKEFLVGCDMKKQKWKLEELLLQIKLTGSRNVKV